MDDPRITWWTAGDFARILHRPRQEGRRYSTRTRSEILQVLLTFISRTLTCKGDG